MSARGWLHWFTFVAYGCTLFALPLALLWGGPGIVLGLSLSAGFHLMLRIRGTTRILHRLKAQLTEKAEAPYLHRLLEEYCRRAQLPAAPRLAIIQAESLNAGVLGFSQRRAVVVITSATLQRFNKEQLSALMGRLVVQIHSGEIACDAWLSQFLSLIDRLAFRSRRAKTTYRRFYAFRSVLRQLILFPLALFPYHVLRCSPDPEKLDMKSLRMTRKPHGLAECLRAMEATEERFPLVCAVSVRHLFLVSPLATDPIVRLFFTRLRLTARIKDIEKLRTVVAVAP